MKLGVLFSGGKDSTYALAKALRTDDVVCLISLRSQNPESYMFHTPNISLVELQAEAIGLPLRVWPTAGEKEKELEDLRAAIAEAKREFGLDGIVTGAVASVYQSSRIQKLCDELGLKCINPLWMKDQRGLLEELLAAGFDVMISGVFAEPLDASWLGRHLDAKMIDELSKLRDKSGVSPSGEGGELETTVLDAPFFKRRLEIVAAEKKMSGSFSGVYVVKEARLIAK